MRIKHEEGYTTYKALVDGHGFHSETVERQKRLQQASKATKERSAEAKQGSRPFPKTFTHKIPDPNVAVQLYDVVSASPLFETTCPARRRAQRPQIML